MFNPKEYNVGKVTVRGWDPKKKEEIVGVSGARSLVQDFEKNTENVSGGFGLMGGSKELQSWWQEAAKGKSIRKNISF